jgi:hypothetical protein
MAHYRKPLAAAVALNTAIFIVEAIAGLQSKSLSLVMDSVHNFSDEMALAFLYLCFVLPLGVSRNLLRSANIFNSLGLVAMRNQAAMASNAREARLRSTVCQPSLPLPRSKISSDGRLQAQGAPRTFSLTG